MSNDREHPLISYLQSRAEDRAMLAALRRGLGKAPGEVPVMFPYVVPFIGQYNEANLYRVASLFGLHPQSTDKGNMGAHLYQYALAVGDDAATTRRFTQLLRLNLDSFDSPLRQHVAMLKSKDIPINWHQLLFDLNYWDHPERFVQRNWAAQYWPPTKSSKS